MKKDDVDFIDMYIEYCTELEKYFVTMEKMTKPEMVRTAEEYLHDRYSKIIHARPGKGFLVVSRSGGDCHPMADYAISQLFIRPEYRRKGIAKALVGDFVNANRGVYALDILKENAGAKAFWDSVIAENGWKDANLPNLRFHSTDSDCVLYGFISRGSTAMKSYRINV